MKPWQKIKECFGFRTPATQVDRAAQEASAKEFLQALRENELSVGADMRRGKHSARAPGQTRGGDPALKPPYVKPTQNIGSPESGSASPTPPQEDFALSATVGLTSGSAVLGYAAGGSLLGGIVGQSLSDIDPASNPD